MKAVILAGGKGARLQPYTAVLPKPLMPVGDMPILEIVIRQLKAHGVSQIVMAVGHLAQLVEAYFGDGQKYAVEIEYSREDIPLGTAGPLSLISGLNDTFLVMNGDILTTLDYSRFVQYHKERQALATVAAHHRSVRIDFGIIKSNQQNEIVNYVEKPDLEYLVSMGIYVFEPTVLQYVAFNQKLDFPDLVKRLIENGQRVVCYPSDDLWLDIGRHEDYAKAIEEFEQNRERLLPQD